MQIGRQCLFFLGQHGGFCLTPSRQAVGQFVPLTAKTTSTPVKLVTSDTNLVCKYFQEFLSIFDLSGMNLVCFVKCGSSQSQIL